MSRTLARTILSTPAHKPRMSSRSRVSGADAVFLDLEDAVPPSEKEAGREAVLATLREDDWSAVSVGVRINAAGTEWGGGDLDLLGQVDDKIDFVVIPKVTDADDVCRVSDHLDGVEGGYSEGGVQIEILVEAAAALLRIEQILASSARVTAVTLGAGDLAASLGTRTKLLARELPASGLDFWHPVRITLLTAARAMGIAAYDGPFGNFKDEAGFARKCRLAAGLGFDGTWVIHPSQIEIAHHAFAYSDEEVAWARSVLALLADGGAAYLEGQGMVDSATELRARRVLQAHERTLRGTP